MSPAEPYNQKKIGIKAFDDALRIKKIFDIKAKKLKPFQDFIHFPVGQPSVVSNQGTKPTCASHAMGKVVVEILNNFNLNCSQTKIIDDLIRIVQPDEEPVTIYKFNFTNIDLSFWEENDETHPEERKVTLVVQHQVMMKSWLRSWTPAMTKKQLEEHNTKILAVYQTKSAKYSSHAVFVKDFEQTLGPETYIFTCINSWGEKTDPELRIGSKDIVALYYISLIELAPGENFVQAGATPTQDKSALKEVVFDKSKIQ